MKFTFSSAAQKIILICLSLLLAGLLVYIYSSESRRQNELINQVKKLNFHELRIEKSLLKIKHHEELNFDYLNANVAAIQNLLMELQNDPYGITKLKEANLEGDLAELVREFSEKVEIIEQFKTKFAVLKNSTRYFHNLISRIPALNYPAEFEGELYRLQHEIYNVIFYRKVSIIPGRLEPLYTELTNNIALLDEQQKQHILQLIKHGRLIVEYSVAVDELRGRNAAINYENKSLKFEQNLLSFFIYQQDQKSHFLNILFATALFAIAVIILLIHLLIRKSVDLKQALMNIENQKFALDQHAIVSSTDIKGNITYVNEKFCEISGYSQEELIGNNHRLINSGHHPKSLFKDMWRTIRRGEVWHGEIKNARKGGGYYWVNATIVPFLDSQSQVYQYISIRTDISLLKRFEEELIQGKLFLDNVTNAMAQGLYAQYRVQWRLINLNQALTYSSLGLFINGYALGLRLITRG